MNSLPDYASSTLSRLLTGLAAGADQKLFSVDSWANRLGDDPGARPFVAQMREEWCPITIPNEFCQQMMDTARNALSWHAGWPNLWAHTLRVTGTLLALAPEASVDLDHAFMIGIFHDIGKLNEIAYGDSHEAIGARMARRVLTDHYSPTVVTLISNVIGKKASSANPYTQLLYDADKLDKIGATGIARRMSLEADIQNVRYTLQRVQDDAIDFPAMHFPTSTKLSASKLEFTEAFFDLSRFAEEV
ncbi:MAG: HD domain-containing protein [Chloroflexota bacterium]